MDYEWDEAKRIANISKHGIDFFDVPSVFDRSVLQWIDNRRPYGEVRCNALGLLNDRIVSVSFTDREGVRRIISARKANDREQRLYSALQAR
ncbi:MAG: hypothetical protein RLY86_2881 [Pseudomonadota bacterium]|jgi:uncharacterized DUF497 family protein